MIFTLSRIHISYLENGVQFQLRRWAPKIMSLVISANRLFLLTQSCHLRKLLDGTFRVEVLSSTATTPFHCDMSHRTVQMALDAAVFTTMYLDANDKETRQSFITECSKVPSVIHLNPMVHAELAMIIAMVERKIERPGYIGLSKVCCIMCSIYIRTFEKMTGEKVITRGSCGRAYPGWVWPSHPDSDCDTALSRAFLTAIRRQLRRDFDQASARRRWGITLPDEPVSMTSSLSSASSSTDSANP